MPPPGPPPPPPEFPAAAAPGLPPPPLPPLPPFFASRITDLGDDVVDPALEKRFDGLVERPVRLSADPSPDWSTVTLVRAEGPMRHTRGPRFAFWDEGALGVTVARIPGPSLPDAPPGTDLLSRLRMVHRKLIPGFAQRPVDATWQRLDGRTAVLDRLSDVDGGRICGFSFASAVDDGGLIAVGWSPPDRTETLQAVALPLAGLVRVDGAGLSWAKLPLWSCREELQISTESVLATVTLEALRPDQTLADWTSIVYGRAPFLRGMKTLGDRPVSVRGVDEAWMSRFDWQPSARGRTLTTVVTGLSAGEGFSFVVEVPFEGEHLLLDPDAILALVEVRPPAPPRPMPAPPALDLPVPPRPPAPAPAPPWRPQAELPTSIPWPPAPPPPSRDPMEVGSWSVPTYVPSSWEVSAPPSPPVPPFPPSVPALPTSVPPLPPSVPLPVAPRDRYLDAAVDRLLVAAVDAVDGARIPGPQQQQGWGADKGAVEAALLAILGRAFGPPLPWHGRSDIVALVSERVALWRGGAESALVATSPGTSADLTTELWLTASLVARVATQSRDGDIDNGGLAEALQRVRRWLPEPDAAWDDALFTVQAGRTPRYRFRTFFDPGSGTLLWSANPETNARWDYPADHYDLPIPLPLAHWVQGLIDRHDAHNPDLARDRRPFTPPEWQAFAAEYAACIAELRRTLGPAYVIDDQSRIAG